MSVVEMRKKKTQQNCSMVPRFNASITDISKQIYAHTMGPQCVQAMSERNQHTKHWCARQRKKNPSTLHVFYVLASLKFAFDYCSFTLYSLVLLPRVVCVFFFRRVVLLFKPQLIFSFRLLQTIDSLSFFIPCLRFKQLRFYTIFVYPKSV